MAYKQKWTIVSFIDPVKEGLEFNRKEWPLHITIACAGAFDMPLNSEEFIVKLKPLISGYSPVKTSSTSFEQFGAHKVTILDKTKELNSLHKEVISLIESLGGSCGQPEYVLENFRPHCTVQKSGNLQLDTDVTLNSISLVDMFPNSNGLRRKVTKNFEFN
jgi:2'-5' RNA ligase